MKCIELLAEIEARLDFDDEMPDLDLNILTDQVHSMEQEVQKALDTANYDKFLQSGLQVYLWKCLFSPSFHCFPQQIMRIVDGSSLKSLY